MGKTGTKMDRLGILAAGLALVLLPGSAFAQGRSNNFLPLAGAGQSIAATTTSGSVTLTGESLNQADIWIFNAGTDYVFCRWGVGAQTAATTDIPFPSGTVNIVSRGATGVNTVACRANTTTATVYIVPGNGF
jgi:hypothetical protein